MISPLERARVLDAEMQLQRAWLELILRELSSAAREFAVVEASTRSSSA